VSALQRLRDLPSSDRALLLRAGLVLCWVRLGLWVIPRRLIKQALTPAVAPGANEFAADRPAPSRIGWAVRVAARYVPRTSCLPQALACHALLVRNGHPSHLRIGVAIPSAKTLRAHAWVECRGEIVIGETESSAYTPLPTLKDAPK
jgi:hypothetical protein